MKSDRAIVIGRRRATAAARLLEERLKMSAEELCVLRPGAPNNGCRDDDRPVGQRCFADIRTRQDPSGDHAAWVVIVDEVGTVKAASVGTYAVLDAVLRARSLGLPVSRSKGSLLAAYLRRPRRPRSRRRSAGGDVWSDDSYIRWDL